MDTTEFAERYRSLSNDELLLIAAHKAELTDEAKTALSAELATRRIGSHQELQQAREAENRYVEETKRISNDLKRASRSRFGKANYRFDRETGVEQFTTTEFITARYGLPLIPRQTIRVRRKKGWRNWDDERVEKLPLDWDQVFRVWGVTLLSTAGIFIAAVLIMKILHH